MITLNSLTIKNFICVESADFDFINNYITVFFGANGSGKCIEGSTRIKTKQFGELPIKELFKKLEVSPSVKMALPKEGLEVWTDEGWKSIEAFWITPPEPLWELELDDGIVLRASADHRVMTQRGWVKLKDLQESDEILREE